ncbi:hypothetical protein [Streptomyces sp. NBC_01264]|uniref:hypothetical protein n=1 Tax=Streptomyces sp. NBC_01264 TaxID=2903804 RepID=UPI002254C862|nr:hypothetical protein [Streptomyces sp. NBC_01264]MCX4780136.1 hypothetical protein [Streptomyces sp. NBC_01264]
MNTTPPSPAAPAETGTGSEPGTGQGPRTDRWATFHADRTLVVAARTVTSTVRVLECLPALVRDDGRISVVFAHDPTSAFGEGVLDLLHDAGCRVIPWDRIPEAAPDLILSASENIEVPAGDCPVLVLPHGIGFQKLVPDSRADRVRLSGLVPDALLEAGRAWLAVSHPGQEEQLLAAHPKTAGHTLLVGDPCYDELLAGLARRPAHRRALGVPDDRRLVVVSSTWARSSLIGQDPKLPARLLAALPYDEYRVALVLHPNIWSRHGAWQLRTSQLASALAAGLILVPPVHDWRSALVAADLVIGDHGSVTLYGAALGTPVLLGAFGEESVPGTAAASLARLAPRLEPGAGGTELAATVAAAVEGYEPGRYVPVARQAFAEPGRAHARLRGALYRLLRLAEPDSAPPCAPSLPLPEPPRATPCTAWWVTTGGGSGVTGPGAGPIAVRRFPAAAGEPAPGDGSGTGSTHLACEDTEPDRHLAESASVVLGRAAGDPAGWVADTLAAWPGAALAAVTAEPGAVLVGLRDGRTLAVEGSGDPGLAAAAVYACLRSGPPLADAEVTLRLGTVPGQGLVRLRLRLSLQGGAQPLP